MYHQLHGKMTTDSYTSTKSTAESDQKEEEVPFQSPLFLCTKCNKKLWTSVETFRVHKSNCKKAGLACCDCGAIFSSRQEYKEHVKNSMDGEQEEEAKTWVCPLHCGLAFSSKACLQHHSLACLRAQVKGPYSAFINNPHRGECFKN